METMLREVTKEEMKVVLSCFSRYEVGILLGERIDSPPYWGEKQFC